MPERGAIVGGLIHGADERDGAVVGQRLPENSTDAIIFGIEEEGSVHCLGDHQSRDVGVDLGDHLEGVAPGAIEEGDVGEEHAGVGDG